MGKSSVHHTLAAFACNTKHTGLLTGFAPLAAGVLVLVWGLQIASALPTGFTSLAAGVLGFDTASAGLLLADYLCFAQQKNTQCPVFHRKSIQVCLCCPESLRAKRTEACVPALSMCRVASKAFSACGTLFAWQALCLATYL